MSDIQLDFTNGETALLDALIHEKPVAFYCINKHMQTITTFDGEHTIISDKYFNNGWLSTPKDVIQNVFNQNGTLPVLNLMHNHGEYDVNLPNDMLVIQTREQIAKFKKSLRDNLEFYGLSSQNDVKDFYQRLKEQHAKNIHVANVELHFADVEFEWENAFFSEETLFDFVQIEPDLLRLYIRVSDYTINSSDELMCRIYYYFYSDDSGVEVYFSMGYPLAKLVEALF